MKTIILQKQSMQLLWTVVVTLLTVPTDSLGHPAVIDTAVYPGNGHTYHLLENSTWLSAEYSAVSLGGHLATVNNQSENDWISSQWGNGRSLWIGLNDGFVQGSYEWSSGEPVIYTNWRAGEPSNTVGEDFAYIYAAGLGPLTGKWNDVWNVPAVVGEPPFYGIVEVVPEPAPSLLFVGAAFLWLLKLRLARKRPA